MNDYLFEELGFQGNQQEYYHPGNSCLNEVLTKRLGIPISLSVVYIEIARRLGRTVMVSVCPDTSSCNTKMTS